MLKNLVVRATRLATFPVTLYLVWMEYAIRRGYMDQYLVESIRFYKASKGRDEFDAGVRVAREVILSGLRLDLIIPPMAVIKMARERDVYWGPTWKRINGLVMDRVRNIVEDERLNAKSEDFLDGLDLAPEEELSRLNGFPNRLAALEAEKQNLEEQLQKLANFEDRMEELKADIESAGDLDLDTQAAFDAGVDRAKKDIEDVLFGKEDMSTERREEVVEEIGKMADEAEARRRVN